MSLRYELHTLPDRVSMHLSGRIDRDAADALDTAYRQAAETGINRVGLDFGDVEYINSTGIALIVGLLGKARADSSEVHANGLSEHYRHIFEITRLSDFITIDDERSGGHHE